MKQSKNPLGTYYAVDMYNAYIEKELRNNPDLCTKYDLALALKGIRLLVRVDSEGKREIVMSYTIFRSILDKCNKLIIDVVSEGNAFYFGKSLGFMRGIRIPRNFKKKSIDFNESRKLRQSTGDNKIIVYRTDDTYCRISWEKLKDLRNSTLYEFTPARGYKVKFSNALMADSLLELTFPFIKKIIR